MGKKKYIKNSNGVTMSVTTDTLGLEKPLLNENYDIDVHNRNMDKIDEDLKPIDDSYIIELFQHDGDTTNPKDYYTKSEIDAKVKVIENATSKLQTKVDNGQNHKLTSDDGEAILLDELTDINTITTTGNYVGHNLQNAPTCAYALWYYLDVKSYGSMCMQTITQAVYGNRSEQYIRALYNGEWSEWREL